MMSRKTRKNKDKQDVDALYLVDDASRFSAYQDIEERRLKEWENFQKSHRTPEDQKLNRAFIDISIDDALAGRLVIDLFDNVVPKTVEHFRALITGALGVHKRTGKKIDYLRTKITRVDTAESLLYFGSMASNTVSCIEDENFSLRHTERGLLTMVSHGPNTASFSFGITLNSNPALDFKQVVFGKVVNGNSLLDKLESIPTNQLGKPLTPPIIAFCGVLTGVAPPGYWKVSEKTCSEADPWDRLMLSAKQPEIDQEDEILPNKIEIAETN